MTIAIRYYTRSGNTERLAKAVGEALGLPAETVEVPLGEKADLLFLGCSYYGFDVDEHIKTFLQENKENIGRVVSFGTSAMMKSIRKPLKKVTDQAGLTLEEREFHCRGSFGPLHKGRPDQQDEKAAAAFAKELARQMGGN